LLLPRGSGLEATLAKHPNSGGKINNAVYHTEVLLKALLLRRRAVRALLPAITGAKNTAAVFLFTLPLNTDHRRNVPRIVLGTLPFINVYRTRILRHRPTLHHPRLQDITSMETTIRETTITGV
jgi:hypothetical protein